MHTPTPHPSLPPKKIFLSKYSVSRFDGYCEYSTLKLICQGIKRKMQNVIFFSNVQLIKNTKKAVVNNILVEPN